MSSGRAVVRFSDLVELADLVGRLSDKSAPVDAGKCKDNYAATVRQITPQERQDDVFNLGNEEYMSIFWRKIP